MWFHRDLKTRALPLHAHVGFPLNDRRALVTITVLPFYDAASGPCIIMRGVLPIAKVEKCNYELQ